MHGATPDELIQSSRPTGNIMAKFLASRGLMDPVMAARPTADTFSRISYLSAAASRVDSYSCPTTSTV